MAPFFTIKVDRKQQEKVTVYKSNRYNPACLGKEDEASYYVLLLFSH